MEDGYQTCIAEKDRKEHGTVERGLHRRQIAKEAGLWVVGQGLDYAGGGSDWGITAAIDLAASDEAGEAVLTVIGLESM